jgi:HK97 family phage prohead protease
MPDQLNTSGEAATRLTFDDPEVTESFSVDAPRRLISGTIVPWGKVAKSGFSRWRFNRGALHWSQPSRIKLNTNHDHKLPIAKALDIQNTALGLDATFKVARGEEGDRALALAEDGVLDGFSVEVDFDEGDGWAPDPENENVRLVDRGRLVGVALTGFPAFDDARVERVAAARQGGEMTDKQQEQQQEPVTMDAEQAEATFETAMERLAGKITDSQVKLSEQLAQSVGESISEGVKTALEDIGQPQARGTVRAARYSVTREAPIYTFDGRGDCLIRDAWNAVHGKEEDAIERIRKYRLQTEEVSKLYAGEFGLQFAPQTTSTASQVIPPGYRPDLYIADLFRGRPFVNAASRGSIANATPFTVPVFSSATSVTADHTEGTNPSDGSLAFTTKTVTPQAVSGRLTLSREIVDSSNPAIDQIAIQEMRESYARQTEAKVYTLLNGSSGAGGTITAGFVPSGAQAATFVGTTGTPPALVAGIRSRLAAYPFARFASPNGALMGQNATTILATSVDTTGRPIFPSVGPTNATGIGRAADQAWSVDGMAFQPAWAATGSAAGDTQIFILDSSDLWVWESPLLSFRFEEKQGPANIELNVFGYFATHLLRPVGLSGIRIT